MRLPFLNDYAPLILLWQVLTFLFFESAESFIRVRWNKWGHSKYEKSKN